MFIQTGLKLSCHHKVALKKKLVCNCLSGEWTKKIMQQHLQMIGWNYPSSSSTFSPVQIGLFYTITIRSKKYSYYTFLFQMHNKEERQFFKVIRFIFTYYFVRITCHFFYLEHFCTFPLHKKQMMNAVKCGICIA